MEIVRETVLTILALVSTVLIASFTLSYVAVSSATCSATVLEAEASASMSCVWVQVKNTGGTIFYNASLDTVYPGSGTLAPSSFVLKPGEVIVFKIKLDSVVEGGAVEGLIVLSGDGGNVGLKFRAKVGS